MTWWIVKRGDTVVAEFRDKESANTACNALLKSEMYGMPLRLVTGKGIVMRTG